MKRISLTLASLAFCSVAVAAPNDNPEEDHTYLVGLEAGLLDTVQQALPESQVANQLYLNTDYDPVITLGSDAQVAVTFIDEGAGYRNSLGYFTFDDSSFGGLTFGDIDSNGSGNISIGELQSVSGISTGMVFGNASKSGAGGSLLAGDTVVLGEGEVTNISGADFDFTGGTTFSSGTNLGFFLLQNAWNGNHVQGYDVPGDGNRLAMYSVDFLNPENGDSAFYGSADDDSRHVAMMFTDSDQDELILAFEDLHRTDNKANHRNYSTDEDFNDAVFRVKTNPVSAIFETNVPQSDEVISVNAAPLGDIGQTPLGAAILGAIIFCCRIRYSA